MQERLVDLEWFLSVRGFVLTLIELVGLVLGPEAAFVYRVVLSDSGVG